MTLHHLAKEQFLPIPLDQAWDFFFHYALPFGPFGAIAHGIFVRRKLEAVFAFRREILARRFGAA